MNLNDHSSNRGNGSVQDEEMYPDISQKAAMNDDDEEDKRPEPQRKNNSENVDHNF